MLDQRHVPAFRLDRLPCHVADRTAVGLARLEPLLLRRINLVNARKPVLVFLRGVGSGGDAGPGVRERTDDLPGRNPPRVAPEQKPVHADLRPPAARVFLPDREPEPVLARPQHGRAQPNRARGVRIGIGIQVGFPDDLVPRRAGALAIVPPLDHEGQDLVAVRVADGRRELQGGPRAVRRQCGHKGTAHLSGELLPLLQLQAAARGAGPAILRLHRVVGRRPRRHVVGQRLRGRDGRSCVVRFRLIVEGRAGVRHPGIAPFVAGAMVGVEEIAAQHVAAVFELHRNPARKGHVVGNLEPIGRRAVNRAVEAGFRASVKRQLDRPAREIPAAIEVVLHARAMERRRPLAVHEDHLVPFLIHPAAVASLQGQAAADEPTAAGDLQDRERNHVPGDFPPPVGVEIERVGCQRVQPAIFDFGLHGEGMGRVVLDLDARRPGKRHGETAEIILAPFHHRRERREIAAGQTGTEELG